MVDDNNLIKTQYEQLWKWKKFHAELCWKVPVMLGAIAGLAAHTHPPQNKWIYGAFFLYIIGMFVLFLRHNAFQKGVTLVIRALDNEHPLPNGAGRFIEFYENKAESNWQKFHTPVFRSFVLVCCFCRFLYLYSKYSNYQ